MAKPCRVVVSPQLAEVLNLEPNQDLSYREWVQILHDGGLDKLADRALVALGEVKKGAKEAVELQNELEVREQRSINEPRDAKDVAIIFRKLFNFSPFEAVAAARIFDAKAARMSKLLGVSKEDYYKRYWFTKELSEKGKQLNQIVGENAQLAQDIRDNLQVARDMETAGKDAKTIRLATGWEKGKDGKWRYEIEDINIVKNIKDIPQKTIEALGNYYTYKEVSLSDLIGLEHPLIKSYPNAKNIKVVLYDFQHPKGTSGEYRKAYKNGDIDTITLWGVDYNNILSNQKQSTLLHEIQHFVQKEENFAKGGSPEGMLESDLPINPRWNIFNTKENKEKVERYNKITSTKEYQNELDASNKLFTDEYEPKIEQIRSKQTRENYKELSKQIDDLFKEFDAIQKKKFPILSEIDELAKNIIIREPNQKISKFDAYRQLAGEVEARNVQKRIGMTPEQRRATTLQETEDVARDEQIVLFGEQEGGLSQMTLPNGREVTVKRMSPEVVNGFYSPIEKNLMEYGKDKIKAKDWLNVVGKGDEAVFTGVRAFLEGKDPNAMVSKQEILDHMKDNRISVVEVVKGKTEWNEVKKGRWERPIDKENLQGKKTAGKVVIQLIDGKYYGEPSTTKYTRVFKSLEEAQSYYDAVDGFSTDTKFSQYQLEGEKENYKEIMAILPRTGSMAKVGDYKVPSAHQYGEDLSDNRRLVHLRMNTRTDADGKKVLFLEEVQSDWGQLGKKEGFEAKKNKIKWREPRNVNGYKVYDSEIGDFTIIDRGGNNISLLNENGEEIFDGRYTTVQEAKDGAENEARQFGKGLTPTAPFVMDTNAWTKLGLKVALKEAVAQGVDKIAWTTGEQQNDRYDLSKQVDAINWTKLPNGNFDFTAVKDGAQQMGDTDVSISKLADYVGKDVAEKIIEQSESRKYGTLSGVDLKVGGKGMKGFYGSMEEGTKGIVGGVAEKLFGQKVGETKIPEGKGIYGKPTISELEKAKKLAEDANDDSSAKFLQEQINRINKGQEYSYALFNPNEPASEYFDKVRELSIYTQPSIDITPELKAQVQEGLPLFQGDRKGAWSKEAAKAKRIISMYQKADSTTQAHEVVGHDFLDEIIQLSSTNEEMAEDLNTIVDEFIKETGSKVSKEKLLKDLKDFDVEKKQNKNGKDIHEWFAESAERYFATERGAREGAGFSKKMVALFEKFRQYMADLYSKMNKELVEPSPAMKQIFRKIFGAENFAEAEEMRKATFDRMNSLQASELEMNYSKSKPKLSDIMNKYKPKEGLGQLSDDFVQDMYNAASIIVKDGEATRWNVTNKLQELMPHLKSEIEQLRKVLQEVGTKGNLRGGVENLLANPYITDEIKEKIAKLSEYTPESMAKVGLNAEQILSYYIGEADNNDIVGMQTVAKLLAEGKFNGFTEKVSLRQLLIANYNQLAKITKDENKRIDYVNAAVDQAEAYAIEGTGMGRMINMYKALGSLTADGLIVWAKRQEMKFTKPSFERFKSEIKDLKKRLKKAQEDIDYFFEQVVGREETEAQYKEVIAAYQAEIDALKARKPKEPKASKSAYRNVKKQRQFNDSDLSELAKEVLASKLFQDMSNLTPAQKLAYAIMERKPTNISELAKQFSKYLGKKVDASELRELYQQTRDFLITQDIGYAEGLSANEELEKDLQDLEDTKRAKIEELERKKAAAEAELAEKKAKKEGKAQDPADKLSNFVLSDLKRAMSGTLPKQKTYVEELLSALTQKAKEVALKGEKETQKQAPITPIEAIKKALDAIQNGRPDASIWNDAVEQVKQKIEQDSDLSQQDKEDLNLYLNDYTSFVYDNMLNDSVILKAIKENLIANGYGSGNTVNFKALIVADGQAQMQERQRLIEKLKQDLSQYDPVQVEKVLDAIAERYQRLINEKRKQIADEYINQTFKTKSPSTRRAIRGTIGKLIMENRMGLFDDTNNAILDALAEKKGFTNMTSADWAKIKEYADLVEALPLDSNLQNEALEEMTAFVRTKMPGRWLLIATAVRYGVLLGRITSNIKNAVGGFEQALTLTLARAMRGDTEFGKSALKGFGQGDFKDVLIGGGINQANRISVEADANGMPRFRVLEYLKPKTIGGKVVESVKYSGRMLDAMDAIWQKFFTSGYDVKYMRKLLELENPNATKQEIDDMVSKIFSNDRIADYIDQATKEVIASGKKVTEAKVRRRAYEIMRDSLVRPIAKQLSDFESTEKTYKTDFAENKGVGTLTGAVALYIANSSKKIVEPIVEKIMEVRGDTKELAEEKAKIYSSIIPNFILPFSKGLSGFIEKGLERELIYGLTKSIAVSIAAKSKNPTTIEEKMAQYRAIEKAKDIATSAVVTNLILYGIGGALYAMSKQWEDDEEKEGRYHPKTGVYGKAKPMTIKGVTVKEKAEPENVIVLFGKEIPLSYVGGLGVTAMVDANLYKAFTEETDERKKTKAMEVASNFGTAILYTMDSFLSQAWLMQASDNKSITEMIQEGNTERALNLIQNTMINYMGSYIPWSGFINQSLQGARELSGGETYQEAKTISEKIQKQFGLAGITYTNTKKNYLGEDIKYSDVNKEGIIGLVNMFKTKSISAEDNWLRNIGFKEKASGQYAKGLKDLDGYSPSIEEYDRYDDRTKSMFGIIAKEAYNQKANIVPLPDEINRVTKKPYTVDEFQSKVMRSALSAVSKYNIVRLKKERGDYNSDKDAYEQDMENAFYNLDEVADIIYYKKGDEYKNRKRKKDALIDKVTEIK